MLITLYKINNISFYGYEVNATCWNQTCIRNFIQTNNKTIPCYYPYDDLFSFTFEKEDVPPPACYAMIVLGTIYLFFVGAFHLAVFVVCCCQKEGFRLKDTDRAYYHNKRMADWTIIKRQRVQKAEEKKQQEAKIAEQQKLQESAKKAEQLELAKLQIPKQPSAQVHLGIDIVMTAQTTCSLCQKALCIAGIKILPCTHVFHDNCINRYNGCPLCVRSIAL